VLTGYLKERAPELANPRAVATQVQNLVTFWQDKTLDAIAEPACRAYGRWRNVSAGTWGNDLITLRAAIGHDYQHGRLTRVVPVWTPPRPEPRDRVLSRSEIAALIRAARRSQWARDHLPRFILLAYYLAGRKEAILSLRWAQVDLDAGTVDLRRPGQAQTAKRRAYVHAPRRLVAHMRRWRRRGTPTGFVVTYHGGPVQDVRRGFSLAVRAAGLDGKVSPHVLRHSAAAHMAADGVDLKAISLYLGHTSVSTTERNYAHYSPLYTEQVADWFDRRLTRRLTQNRRHGPQVFDGAG